MPYHGGDKKREIFERIKRVVKNMLQISQEQEFRKIPEIRPETDIFKELGIDSVEIMDLMGLIEREFGVSIELEKVSTKRTFDEIVDYVDELLERA